MLCCRISEILIIIMGVTHSLSIHPSIHRIMNNVASIQNVTPFRVSEANVSSEIEHGYRFFPPRNQLNFSSEWTKRADLYEQLLFTNALSLSLTPVFVYQPNATATSKDAWLIIWNVHKWRFKNIINLPNWKINIHALHYRQYCHQLRAKLFSKIDTLTHTLDCGVWFCSGSCFHFLAKFVLFYRAAFILKTFDIFSFYNFNWRHNSIGHCLCIRIHIEGSCAHGTRHTAGHHDPLRVCSNQIYLTTLPLTMLINFIMYLYKLAWKPFRHSTFYFNLLRFRIVYAFCI